MRLDVGSGWRLGVNLGTTTFACGDFWKLKKCLHISGNGVEMGVLDCGRMAIKGFWDNFGMRHAEVIFEEIERIKMPDAVITACKDCGHKHMLNPRLELMWEMGNVASAICRAHELTTEVRQQFGDLSLMAWWWADRFDRRTIEMAQEALAKANIDWETRTECERKLDWALFFLENAEEVAQDIVVQL